MVDTRLDESHARAWRQAASVLAVIITLRAGYALLLLFAGYAYRSGHLLDAHGDTYFLVFTLGLNPIEMALWTGYVIGYLTAAALIIRRSRLALPAYIIAFAIDLGCWIYSATHQLYPMINNGLAVGLDHAFNVLDAAILLALVFLVRRGQLR